MALIGVGVGHQWPHGCKEQRVISRLQVKGRRVALESYLITNAPVDDNGIIGRGVRLAYYSRVTSWNIGTCLITSYRDLWTTFEVLFKR